MNKELREKIAEKVKKIILDAYKGDVDWYDTTDEIISTIKSYLLEKEKLSDKEKLLNFHKMVIMISKWMKEEGLDYLDIQLSSGRWAIRVQKLIDQALQSYKDFIKKI